MVFLFSINRLILYVFLLVCEEITTNQYTLQIKINTFKVQSQAELKTIEKFMKRLFYFQCRVLQQLHSIKYHNNNFSTNIQQNYENTENIVSTDVIGLG